MTIVGVKSVWPTDFALFQIIISLTQNRICNKMYVYECLFLQLFTISRFYVILRITVCIIA